MPQHRSGESAWTFLIGARSVQTRSIVKRKEGLTRPMRDRPVAQAVGCRNQARIAGSMRSTMTVTPAALG